MPELKLPDQLVPDCDNCQGLCCMTMEHRVIDGFPIEQDKPAKVPCQHLGSDPERPDSLYKCDIYDNRYVRGWRVCETFTCYGSGQTVSNFFNELGVSWALKSPDMDESEHQRMLINLHRSFYVLYKVLNFLQSFDYGIGLFHRERYVAAKTAATDVAAQFSQFLNSGQEVDAVYWVDQKFIPTMQAAANEAGESAMKNYFRTKVSTLLSIFK